MQKCQISAWNRTDKPKTFLGHFHEFVGISVDALLAAWAGNLMAYLGWSPKLSSITHSLKKGTDLVLESNKAFHRSIYHLHQELEFTVPFEDTFEMCRRFVELYQKIYAEGGLPYALFEVRFTLPNDRTRSEAGPARSSTCIALFIPDLLGFKRLYPA